MSIVAIAGSTFRLRIELESQAAAGTFQASPTVASGDVKLLILPASPAGSETYANSTNAPTLLDGPTAEVIIAAAETTAAGDGGEIIAVWADAAGDEWYSQAVHIQVRDGDLVTPSTVNAEVVDVMRTDTIPDSYAADGAQPTIAQAVLAIQQYLQERSVSGTTVTVKKPDGSTTAMTFTLDDADAPTSQTRAS